MGKESLGGLDAAARSRCGGDRQVGGRARSSSGGSSSCPSSYHRTDTGCEISARPASWHPLGFLVSRRRIPSAHDFTSQFSISKQ